MPLRPKVLRSQVVKEIHPSQVMVGKYTLRIHRRILSMCDVFGIWLADVLRCVLRQLAWNTTNQRAVLAI